MRTASVLICQDDAETIKLLEDALTMYRLQTAGTVEDARALLATWVPDLILLDIVPGETEAWWELLRFIRKRSTVPVIFVSALSRADDRVRGLRAGADDFISKPFHLEEVLARVEAVLRRGQPEITDLKVTIDDLRKEVCIGDRAISLSPKEYRLLRLLASSPGRVFTSDEILKELWPPKPHTNERIYADSQDVQKYVYLLRKKLEADPQHPDLVITVRGFGYRLGV